MALAGHIRRAYGFYRKADTIYSLHSPFLYDFVTGVLDTSKEFYVFEDIEQLRKKLLRINKEITVIDYGAGSRTNNQKSRKISHLAKVALSSPNECRILFNLINHYKYKQVLELGTSLGIASAYMASVGSDVDVKTIEGNPATAYMAERNFELLGLKNVHLFEGTFVEQLGLALPSDQSLDMAYIDGHHTEKATLDYVRSILHYLHQKSVIVVDDIYWSDGMQSAWEALKQLPEVTCSIDIYSMGFLFFNPDIKEKLHYRLIKSRWKPWALGIFG